MMTREEAIEELERLLSHWDELENGKRSFRWYSKAALEVALSALRPVSREQVEEVWNGCPYCNEDSEGYVQKFGAYSIHHGELATGHCRPQKIKFCPICGKPLADEAVDILLKRLEALKNEEVLNKNRRYLHQWKRAHPAGT